MPHRKNRIVKGLEDFFRAQIYVKEELFRWTFKKKRKEGTKK
jgi:hypothetical protein